MKIKKAYLISLALFLLALFLRFYKLDQFPLSLYWEEAALGYDAYSILKTGADFHGQKFPLVAFKSFGDYKPSGYFYTTVISQAFLGLNHLAVRLPSALAGVAIIIFTFLIAQQIFSQHKQKKLIGFLSALLVAFSPWSFQFSRAAFEANLAAAFSAVAIWFLLKARHQPKNLLASTLFFALSLYTYHSSRIFIPLLLIGFILFFRRSVKTHWRWWLTSAIIGLIIVFPLIQNLNQPAIKHRWQETSAFTDLEPIIRLNQLRQDHNNSLISRAIYHRYWWYAGQTLQKLASHFDLNYLFISGDSNRRHSTGESGIFYPLDAVLLFAGLIFIFKSKNKGLKLLPLWWLAALVPASLTKATPHALRTLLAIPAPQIIAASGGAYLYQKTKAKLKTPLLTIFILIYALFVFRHFYNYFGAYAKNYSHDWQYGYQQLMEFLKDKSSQYETIYITDKLGRPSIYYFFYNQTDPSLVQLEEVTALKDQAERLSFQNIKFELPQATDNLSHSLIITTPKTQSKGDIIYSVKDFNQKTIFNVYEVN